jgi:hypothetical protein
MLHKYCGLGSSVSLVTGYGLDGPALLHLSRPALGHTQPLVDPGSLKGVESSRGVMLTPHRLLGPRSKKAEYPTLPKGLRGL